MNRAVFDTLFLDKRSKRCLSKMNRNWTPTRDELGKSFDVLNAHGFVRLSSAGLSLNRRVIYGDPCHITDDGRAYLQYLRNAKSDRWWTRGLSIAAIVISILTLLLELQGRLSMPKP